MSLGKLVTRRYHLAAMPDAEPARPRMRPGGT
jgi:hypothetical protein